MPSSQHTAGVGFSLVSAPVLFHLEYDSSLYKLIQVGAENVNDVDYAEVYLKTVSFLQKQFFCC